MLRYRISSNTPIYTRGHLLHQRAEVNLADFFAYESSPYPPLLATHGIMHSCTKSDLMAWLLETSLVADCHANLLVNMLVLYSNQEYFMIWQEQREWMWYGMITVN